MRYTSRTIVPTLCKILDNRLVGAYELISCTLKKYFLTIFINYFTIKKKNWETQLRKAKGQHANED